MNNFKANIFLTTTQVKKYTILNVYVSRVKGLDKDDT